MVFNPSFFLNGASCSASNSVFVAYWDVCVRKFSPLWNTPLHCVGRYLCVCWMFREECLGDMWKIQRPNRSGLRLKNQGRELILCAATRNNRSLVIRGLHAHVSFPTWAEKQRNGWTGWGGRKQCKQNLRSGISEVCLVGAQSRRLREGAIFGKTLGPAWVVLDFLIVEAEPHYEHMEDSTELSQRDREQWLRAGPQTPVSLLPGPMT